MFSELNFDGLGVRADWSLCVQGGVCVIQPGLQLRQGMLELTQGQQGSFQLVLWWEEDSGFKHKNRNWRQTNMKYSKRNRKLREQHWKKVIFKSWLIEDVTFLLCNSESTCLWVILSPRLSQRCRSSVSGSWIMSLSVWSDTFLSSSSPWWQSFSMSICCWYTSTLYCYSRRYPRERSVWLLWHEYVWATQIKEKHC